MQKLSYTPGRWRQTIAAIIMNLASFLIGISSGWTSTVSRDVQKENNELGINILTDEEVSWLISISHIGLLLTMSYGPSLCESLGRRKTSIIGSLTYITSWLLKIFATHFYMLLGAQWLGGIGDGLYSLTIPLYVTEMASDTIRGQLGSFFMLGLQSGFLVSFILAATLPFKLLTGCILIIPVTQLVGLLALPEAPGYLIRQNRTDEAKKALMWLRGNDKQTVEADILKLERLRLKITQVKSSFGVKDLFTDRANLISLIISILMLSIQQLSGISILMMYIMTIFDAAEIPVSSHVASIIYACAHFGGCWLSTLTIERFGRRPLLLISTSGMALCHSVLGIFFMAQYFGIDVVRYGWMAIVAITLYGFTYSTGIGPLTIVIPNELFNPELASICNSISTISFSILAFSITKSFPLLRHVVGLHNCFFIFASASVVGFLIAIFIIPETKGRSIESIREGLEK